MVEVIPERRRRTAWLLVVGGLPLGTVALLPVRDSSALEVVLLLYLLAVVVVAVVGGLGPGVVGALVSFLLANFLLTEPYYTLQVEVFERLVELSVFVVVAVLVSAAVEIGARHRVAAEANRDEADAQAARARELAETDRVRAAILAAVSHDLRTPLAGIKAAVSSLRQPDVTWPEAERAELLGTIDDSTDRLDEVVTNLLAMSRIRAGAVSLRPESVVLDEVVGRALLSLGPAAAPVEVAVPEDLPTVTADPDLLERVVANLVMNAVRADPQGPRITAYAEGEGRVLLAVVDRGAGVPEEQWEAMFQPFHRLDERDAGAGSGLGLAIVAGFCEVMAIPVTPSTTPGGGLTMTLTLQAG
ncbi:DUF4118 domain-containing protein [Nocardioides panacisoli]|uniref:sensor histidine kinase n=1 Tax=Nocardioides panacisoli TaxID=627624 RepID=UPI001C62D995|nr:DUF4118 domain-containing protein [Nocardioides panacisoli]QYJ03250.1 DUF4118 domain-containing protein [Nocardioides panacisoli]